MRIRYRLPFVTSYFHSNQRLLLKCVYRKLVETFHIVSECITAIYFSWCLIQALAQPVQLFWLLVTFSIASGNCLTDSDLQLFIETEQDQRRHTFIKYVSKHISKQYILFLKICLLNMQLHCLRKNIYMVFIRMFDINIHNFKNFVSTDIPRLSVF